MEDDLDKFVDWLVEQITIDDIDAWWLDSWLKNKREQYKQLNFLLLSKKEIEMILNWQANVNSGEPALGGHCFDKDEVKLIEKLELSIKEEQNGKEKRSWERVVYE